MSDQTDKKVCACNADRMECANFNDSKCKEWCPHCERCRACGKKLTGTNRLETITVRDEKGRVRKHFTQLRATRERHGPYIEYDHTGRKTVECIYENGRNVGWKSQF